MQVNRRIIYTPALATGAVAAWTPASVSTAFWYDASNAASLSTNTNANPVSSWNDLSGNGRHLSQATSANQPLYTTGVLNSLPGIHFQNPSNSTANSSQMVTSAFTVAQPFTVMMVIKNGAGAVNNINGNNLFAILLQGDFQALISNAYVFLPVHNSFSNHAIFASATSVDSTVLLSLDTGYHVMTVANGASSSTDINGTTTTAQNAGTFGIVNGIAVGSVASNNLVDCYVCEMFCIPDTVNQANALAYVSSKWGV